MMTPMTTTLEMQKMMQECMTCHTMCILNVRNKYSDLLRCFAFYGIIGA